MIKGILIDYGGTIDTNGRHWAHVIWEAYQAAAVGVTKEAFMQAYAFGEKALAINPIIQPTHTFRDVLRLKTEQQFAYLQLTNDAQRGKIDSIVNDCMTVVATAVSAAKPVLEKLAAKYPMVLVSNFYGNIRAVLADLNILHFFQDIVESAVVGVRKPDPAIYRLGVERIGLPAAACVVIGDSFKKDMVAGKEAGCKTIWINVAGFDEDLIDIDAHMADQQVTDFAQIPEAIIQLNALMVN